MNLQQIIQAAALKGANSGKLTESINKARELIESVNRPEETLSKINIDPEFIKNVRSYVDNPMFSWIFPMLKHSKEEVKRGLDRAEEYLLHKQQNQLVNNSLETNNINSDSNGMVVNDELDEFKKALLQLK